MSRSKRVYIAAPWVHRSLIPTMANLLEAAGFAITHKWWEFEGEEEDASWEFKQLCAKKDMAGVRTADAVVVLNSTKSEGKATEQGLALAYGIPIVIIGNKADRLNIFQTLDQYHWIEGTHDVEKGVTSHSIPAVINKLREVTDDIK